MSTPVEEIMRAQSGELVDEDGNVVVLELAPATTDAEIVLLEAELGLQLPHELRTLLGHTAGVAGSALAAIDFTGRSFSVGTEELFPAGLPVASDGYGNHWVLDLTPSDHDVAPVFFLCHDAPVVLYQSPNVAHFLHEVFRMSTPPHESLVGDVHEDRLFSVWRENPGEIEHAVARAVDDDELRSFAAELGDRFHFADLRRPEIGMGFSWGRFGPRTDLRRHGWARLFAYAPPETQPGVFERLFGRRS
jgi:cell wall assembly regulator SMI1